MPSDGDRLASRLLDIVENIDRSREFCAGYDFARFSADDRTSYAVVRALEIVSEASRHVPEEIKARYPGIDWNAIKAAGNVYRHDYKGIDLEIVWDTAQRQLAPLREMAVTEVRRLGHGRFLPDGH